MSLNTTMLLHRKSHALARSNNAQIFIPRTNLYAKHIWSCSQQCYNGFRTAKVQNHRFHAKSNTPSVTPQKFFSSFDGLMRGGSDLLADAQVGGKPKIIFDGYGPTGFDILNSPHAPSVSSLLKLQLQDEPSQEEIPLHYNGSVLAFPHNLFLWKPRKAKDVTLESLSLVHVYNDPSVEMLFIGCDKILPPRAMNAIKKGLKRYGIVVEQMDLTNAIATFNILNAEDRRVAVALVLEEEKKEQKD